MEIKLNIKVIKQARMTKNWTQQQLAEICGLSLRTIQRIEKSGIASQESVASLSSVFEIDKEKFILSIVSNKQQSILRKKRASFRVLFEQSFRYVLSIMAIGMFIIGIIGLINSTLDARVWLLIAVVFSSGILLTMLIMGLSNKISGITK